MTGTGAQAAIAALTRLGVTRVFGMPGIQTLELFDALAEAPFQTILTTDERAAAFMADAHARVTGTLGVLVVTPGPGLTNALTGLAEARLDSSPVLALIAGINTELSRRFQLHAFPQVAVLAPLVKAVESVRTVADIPRAILAAAQVAQAGEPGPVAVEIPHNLFAARGAYAVPNSVTATQVEPDAAILDRMADELAQSPAVAIYAGQGAAAAGADLRRLAEWLEAPVATTISGRGVLPEDHPLSVGVGFGPAGSPVAQRIFRQAHTLLALGCKYSEPATGSYGLTLPQRHLHIDVNPASIGANYPANLALIADAGLAVAGLLRRLEGRPRPARGRLAPRLAALQARQRQREAQTRPLADAVTPARFLRALRARLARADLLAVDSGSHQFWALSDFPVYAPSTFLAPADFQAMGFALPAAIAAQLACPHRRAVCLVGDGGFLLSAMELVTVQRLGLPLVVVVFRDGALGLIREAQQRAYGRAPFTALTNPDLASLAKAFGLDYWAIRCDAEVEAGLAGALGAGRAVLVDVQVCYATPSRYFQGAARTAFAQLPLGRQARLVWRRLWRGVGWPRPTRPY